jgi:hypothetical protein
VWGIGFGLPELFHPDEPAYVLQALAQGRGLPNGLTFANPPLFKYVLLAEYALTFAVERAAGGAQSPQAFVDAFRLDPSLLYGMARVTSAVLGACESVAAGVLAWLLAGRRAALVAAGLCAVAFVLVRDAHFGVDDTLVTLLVTLGLIPCVLIAQGRGAWRAYVCAGVLSGLAFAAKYDGIALLAPLIVAHVVDARVHGARRGRELAVALLACSVAAVAMFPSLVTEPRRVIGDMYLHLYLSATGGYDGLDPSGGYVFYARTLLTGLGLPLTFAAIGGMAWSVMRRHWSSLVVATLPVAMLFVLGSQKLYFARFALPALPALIVEASLAIEALLAWRAAAGIAAALLVALPTLLDSVRFDAILTQADTRTLAREWIDTSLPAGSSLAVDAPPLGPTLDPTRLQVAVADDWSLFDLTPAEYRARGIDYVVVSSFTSEARALDPEREARRQAFAVELPAQSRAVAQFRPYRGPTEPAFAYDEIYGPYHDLEALDRPGPTVTVYRLTR